MDSSIDVPMQLPDPATATREQVEQFIVDWRTKRQLRLDIEKQAEAVKTEEYLLKNWLIGVFQQQKQEGVLIQNRITGLRTNEFHVVDDRDAFITYIYDNSALDLLQFRVSEPAIRAREEAGEEVPGVHVEEAYDLFDRKA